MMRTMSVAIAAMVLCGALAATVEAQQANYGCLANNNCGHKGTTSNAGPRDYWQNWICSGCHSGPLTNFVQSPPERALIGMPARFWSMHAEAARDGETSVRAGSHRLLSPGRITPDFQRLLQERPRGR